MNNQLIIWKNWVFDCCDQLDHFIYFWWLIIILIKMQRLK